MARFSSWPSCVLLGGSTHVSTRVSKRQARVPVSRLVASVVFLLTAAGGLSKAADAGRELRVCADPANLPFSNDRLEGFENKIAKVVADGLHVSLQYVWSPQSGSSVGQMLGGGKCDMVIGAPAGWGPLLTTKPYYTSTYVFVSAKKKHLGLSSFDDPVLRNLRIGLPVMSGGGANPPPAYAIARRGLAGHVTGFPAFEPEKIIDAVAAGEIDVAIVWGPLGGYFAKQESTRLTVTPVPGGSDDHSLQFTYDISMGVRHGDTALKEELERVIESRHREIQAVLERYGVPVVSSSKAGLVSVKSTQ